MLKRAKTARASQNAQPKKQSLGLSPVFAAQQMLVYGQPNTSGTRLMEAFVLTLVANAPLDVFIIRLHVVHSRTRLLPSSVNSPGWRFKAKISGHREARRAKHASTKGLAARNKPGVCRISQPRRLLQDCLIVMLAVYVTGGSLIIPRTWVGLRSRACGICLNCSLASIVLLG